MELPDVSLIIEQLCDGDNRPELFDFVTIEFMEALAKLARE